MISHVYDFSGIAAALCASIHTLGNRLFEFSRAPEFDRIVASKLIEAARAELDLQIATAQRSAESIKASNPEWYPSVSAEAALDSARQFQQELAGFDRESVDDDDGTYIANLHQMALEMFTRDHAAAVRQRQDGLRPAAAKAVSHAN
jgi:hypothetical protein